MRMGRSLRVVGGSVFALAVVLAFAVYLFVRSSGGEWKTVKDDASGITLSHPHEWAVQRFDRYCRRNGPGLLVSNVGGHTFRNAEFPNGCAGGLWKLGGLPDTFALVDVGLFASPFSKHPEEPDSQLPLELDRLERADLTHLNPDLRARIPRGVGYAYGRILRGRFVYSGRVWTGSASSPSNEKALARLIRSIRLSDPRM